MLLCPEGGAVLKVYPGGLECPAFGAYITLFCIDEMHEAIWGYWGISSPPISNALPSSEILPLIS
jgi:hypothetical protein